MTTSEGGIDGIYERDDANYMMEWIVKAFRRSLG